MNEQTDKASDMLRAAKLRRTHGRIQLLDVLLRSYEPLSHDDIVARLPGGAMDRVSIYRALEAFVRVGIVHKVRLDNNRARFEAAHRCESVRCHPHFTCTQCGSTSCLDEAGVPMIKTPQGYCVERQEVYLEGRCSACSSKDL